MAPTELQQTYSGSYNKSVAALFGDDGDSQPLWFKKDAFGEHDFDTEAYIADLRRFVPFDTLKAELRSHQAALKHELVELINRDYADFVNLSTKLVDVDGAVLRMRLPLNELRAKLSLVRESVQGSLAALQDGLKRRAEASASREVLELLLDTSHVLSKVEKLLDELRNMPEDGSHASSFTISNVLENGSISADHADHGSNLEESRSRLLERIASEMNRLKFYVARAQDLPFIKNMEERIKTADLSLNVSLKRRFEGGLERHDETVIYHCLRAYAAIDNTAGAEEVFRTAIVAPFVQTIISSSLDKRAVGGSGNLAEIFEEVEAQIEAQCKFLLDISTTANSGLHVFDFLSNSILKEVHSAVQQGKPGAFSPGKPAEFLANYKASLGFLNVLEAHIKDFGELVSCPKLHVPVLDVVVHEYKNRIDKTIMFLVDSRALSQITIMWKRQGYCQSRAAVESFRSQGAYTDFMKQWNLGVYYTLRFQEIAGALDAALGNSIAPINQGEPTIEEDGSPGLALQPSVMLWDCLKRCWQEDILIKAVSDKFFKLTLQLISRYSTWLSVGLTARKSPSSERPAGGDWALSASPEDILLVSHDVRVLVSKIKGSYVQYVGSSLNPTPEEALTVVRSSILQGADILMDNVPALADVLTETIADKCVEVLKQAKGITATYRMTNKPLPTRHSVYVSSVLQPLKTFLEGERMIYLTEDSRKELLSIVVEKINGRYDEQAREIINTARRTETTLLRFRQGAARQRGAGADTNEKSISDTDKICAQLFLDVQEYGRRLGALGLAVDKFPSYLSLWRSVAPQERQSEVEL